MEHFLCRINPSNDIVNIELNNVQNDFYVISVKNILSQVVYSKSFKANNYLTESIDFSNYEKRNIYCYSKKKF